MIRFEEQADGGEATLHVDEEFEIYLKEDRAAGFQWVTESEGEPVCTLVNESREASAGPPPEKGGAHHWKFRAAQAGRGTIVLHYVRPWETEGGSGQSFRMHVNVKK